MKRILVPTDFSEEANRASNLAIDLASLFSAEVHFIHLLGIPVDWKNLMDSSKMYPDIKEKVLSANLNLNKIRDLAESAQITASTRLELHDDRKEILQYADENDIDLIVIGSKGASGFKELLIGSNTEQIIRHANCPVLTVKDALLIKDVKKILMPTDLSASQKPVAEIAKLWADKLKAKVCVVKLNTHYKWVDSQKFIEEIESFANEYQIKNFEARTHDADYIEDGIIEAAKDAHANLIIMGTHHRTGIAHIIAGSVAEDVANHATGLILTISL